MLKDDRVRILHMLDAAKDAVDFARGRDRTDLDRSRLLSLGLLKCMEIVGEAAARVGPDTRERFPSIPWVDIVGMRNRLVHAYFDIDLDLVWETLTKDLPPLIEEMKRILAAEPEA